MTWFRSLRNKKNLKYEFNLKKSIKYKAIMDVIFTPGDKKKRARQHEKWTNTFVVYNIDHLQDDARWTRITHSAGLSGNGLERANHLRTALISLNGIEAPIDVVCKLAISLGYTCAELKDIGPRHQLLTLCEQRLVRIVRHA